MCACRAAAPAQTLFLMDPANPYRTMEIRARAEIVPDTGGELAAPVEQKYDVDVRRQRSSR